MLLRGTGTCALEELGAKMSQVFKRCVSLLIGNQTEMSFIGKRWLVLMHKRALLALHSIVSETM